MTQAGLIVIALCFLLMTYLRGERANNLMREMDKAREHYHGVAKATVLEVDCRGATRSEKSYYPTLLYEVDGKAYGESGLLYSTNENDFVAGQHLQIRYDELHPEMFMPVDDACLYLMAKNDKNSYKILFLVVCVLAVLSFI